MVKAVVFDMDGVIFDSERCSRLIWEELAEQQGLGDIGPMFRACLGITWAENVKTIESMQKPGFSGAAFLKEGAVLFEERYGGGRLPMKPGVMEILMFLKDQGIRRALATSTGGRKVIQRLRDAGLLPLFDQIITGDMVHNSKPDPEIYLMACDALEVLPGEAFGIEDSFNGVRSSSAAGLRTLMVPDLVEPTQTIRELCEAVLPSLDAVRAYIREEHQRGRS